MKNLTEYLKESKQYDVYIKTTGKHKIKIANYLDGGYNVYEVNVML